MHAFANACDMKINNFAGMIILISKYLKKCKGMTLWPLLLVKDKEFANDAVFMNHEHILAAQQKELIVIAFYPWYGLDYLIQLLKFKNHHRAYRNIVFVR